MSNSVKYIYTAILICWLLVSCKAEQRQEKNNLQIAFMADVHLQDIYGTLQDHDYKGVKNPKTGRFTFARTMQSQLGSTRLFNENYFAFLAALDDVVQRGVRYVVLPGDFSDDGQLVNIRGLKHILNHYSEKYGIHFIATTGNHDPVRPFFQDAGKKDFLGEGGKQQPIYSKEGLYRAQDTLNLPLIITTDIAKLGYEQIVQELGVFGFFPKKTDVYWETPFTTYTYSDYTYQKALEESGLSNRSYKIPPANTTIPDVSYLLEPADDLWFLAIDANVYVPKKAAGIDVANASNYASASIGYNNVLTHKRHLLPWVRSVAQCAEKLNKTLIVFSHYPIIDFNDDATDNIRELLGAKKMQLHRVPSEEVSDLFTKAGIKVHFGGHMHINDTGVRKGLVNVQIPSLAAYIPAYKLLTINKQGFEVETIVIDSVPRYNELFPLYKMEYEHLKKSNPNQVWDKSILKSRSYKEFTERHLRELVKNRFLPDDWKEGFKDFFLNKTAKELMQFATGSDTVENEFAEWTGFDMLFDLYRLRSADVLAFKDIGEVRLKQYKQLIDAVKLNHTGPEAPSDLQKDLYRFCIIFEKFSNGAPAGHFKIDLATLKVKKVD